VDDVTDRPPEFDRFLHTEADGLLRYATAVTADPHLARDVVQSVLGRAWQRWDRIGCLADPPAYVRRMVLNEFLSVRRRLSRVLLTGHHAARGVEPDPSLAAVDRTVLLGQVRTLPPRQRAAVALRYWADMSDAQIADQLGCTESTVRGYLFRALRTLRVQQRDGGIMEIVNVEQP
jgi:RNA polymerase sigma-70 factor (sigma-E family)